MSVVLDIPSIFAAAKTLDDTPASVGLQLFVEFRESSGSVAVPANVSARMVAPVEGAIPPAAQRLRGPPDLQESRLVEVERETGRLAADYAEQVDLQSGSIDGRPPLRDLHRDEPAECSSFGPIELVQYCCIEPMLQLVQGLHDHARLAPRPLLTLLQDVDEHVGVVT